jgi:methylated-DNA-[protein]-cysteine S-methyltransferase
MKNIEFDANLSFKTPMSWMTVFSLNETVVQIEIIGSNNKGPCGNRVIPNHGKAKVLTQAKNEILDFIDGKISSFTFKYQYQGTPFQESVWREVCKVKYGRTITYSEIAEKLDNPGAARAVGTAVGSNPLPILVPCHRVVASGNKLTGYFAGEGVETQQQFIDLERNSVKALKK